MIHPFQHQKLFAEILPDRYVAVVDCRLKDCSSGDCGDLPEKNIFPEYWNCAALRTSGILLLLDRYYCYPLRWQQVLVLLLDSVDDFMMYWAHTIRWLYYSIDIRFVYTTWLVPISIVNSQLISVTMRKDWNITAGQCMWFEKCIFYSKLTTVGWEKDKWWSR